MPGLHDHLFGTLLEPVGEVVVGDDVAGGGERLVPLLGPHPYGARRGRQVHLVVADHPELFDVDAPADHLLVDGARTVRVLRSLERVEEHGGPDLPAPGLRVGLGPEQLLPVRAPGVLRHRGADEEGEPVVRFRLEVVSAPVQFGLLGEAGYQFLLDLQHEVGRTVGGSHGRGVLTAQEEVPAAGRQRDGSGQGAHGGGGDEAAEAVAVPFQRDRPLGAVGPGPDDDMGTGVLGRGEQVVARVAADEFQRAVLVPARLGDQRQRVPFEEDDVAGAVAVDDDLPVPRRGLDLRRHPVVAVRGAFGHHRVQRALAALHVDGQLPPVAAHGPCLGYGVVAVGTRPGHEVAQRDAGGEGAPPLAPGLERQPGLVPAGAVHADDPDLPPLGDPGGQIDAAELQVPAHDPVAGDAAPDDLDAELERAVSEEGHDAGVLVDIAVRGVGGGSGPSPPDALVAEEPAAEDAGGDVPGALDPLPLLLEPSGVEAALEAGPVVAVAVLVGVLGRLRVVDGPGQIDDLAPGLLVPQRQRLGGHVLLVHVDEPDVRRAGQRQPLGVPVRPRERAGGGQFPVEAVVALVQARLAVLQVRVVQVPPEPPADGEGAALALELDDVEQFAQAPLVDQEPLHAGVGGQLLDEVLVGLPQELLGRVHEGVAVLVVRVGQHLEVEHEVGFQARQVVLALVLLVRARPVPAEEPADRLHGGDPVAEVVEFGVPLGDGRRSAPVAPAPEVDDVGDDVDLQRLEVREHVDPGILVEDALGKTNEVVVPERAAEYLVPHGAVIDQRVEPGDVGAATVLLHRPLVQGGLPLLGGIHHLDVARDEIRSGLRNRSYEQFVRVLGNDVVAVREDEELAVRVHGVQPRVPGVPGPLGVLTDQAEARIAGAELLRYGCGPVGRTVVDHDDLEVPERLAGDGLQALVEVGLNVLERDDDTQTRPRGHASLSSSQQQ